MVGFRQILFSKIVPNLKRLGLLTPRVRAKFAELDILEFESLPDSTDGGGHRGAAGAADVLQPAAGGRRAVPER